MQSFFTSYLVGQRGASEHTIRAYRDTMRLLLSYARERTAIEPADLDIAGVRRGRRAAGALSPSRRRGLRGGVGASPVAVHQGVRRPGGVAGGQHEQVRGR